MIANKTVRVKWMLLYVGRPLLLMLAWDVLIVVAFKGLGWEWVGSNYVPLSLYGAAISIIVGFRNNYAYGRWWEARTLWGSIVNSSRNLTREVLTTMAARSAEDVAEQAEVRRLQETIVYHQIAFVHALRQQLRGLDPVGAIRGFIPEEECAALLNERNVSLALQVKMGTMIREARGRGWLNEWEWQAINSNLDNLMDAQGGAERIKGTPMPKQYDFFPKLFVQIYCLMLPIGMVENLGWFTPLGSTIVGFMFLALDKIGRDLQDPFDNQIYDVPLSAITKTIEINLRQLLGESALPAGETPVDDILW